MKQAVLKIHRKFKAVKRRHEKCTLAGVIFNTHKFFMPGMKAYDNAIADGIPVANAQINIAAGGISS